MTGEERGMQVHVRRRAESLDRNHPAEGDHASGAHKK